MPRPLQPAAESRHIKGESTRHHVLYPGSIGKQIETALLEVLDAIWTLKGLADADFPLVELEHPADLAHGDFATNVAMKLAKPLRQNPRQIADEIVERIRKHTIAEQLDNVEVAGPGFINFTLSTHSLLETLATITEQGDDFGRTHIRDGKRIMIEHTQPNSHKEVHVGHLRNSLLGMAEIRLHRAIGYDVISATYGGDVGPHIAKCIWGLQHGGFDIHRATTLDEKVHLIQAAYIAGTQAAAKDPEVETEIKRLNKVIYEKSDPDVMTLYQETRDWSIERQKQVYARIGTDFDRYYWESEVWEKGLQEVKAHIGDVFEESDGAVIFDGEKFGLHKRVFLTSQGTAPYEAKDLGLILLKLQEYDFDYCIIQTGNDHIAYFQVLICAFEQIHPEHKGKIEAEHFGMVNIPSGKMSSREGNVILAEDILDEMHTRAAKELSSRNEEMPTKTVELSAELIGQAATKYAMLKYDPTQDMTFDPDNTLSFNGDSGPYLQYVCARIGSLLAKAGADVRAWRAMPQRPDPTWSSSLHPTARLLLRKLGRLPEIIIRSALEYKPNYLTSYLFDIAQAFNDFYQACTILGAEPEIVSARLALSAATRQVLVNGLRLLGIGVPGRM